MKTEIQELIDEMTDTIICALDVPKYANQTQLEKAVEDLKDLALEVTDFVEGYNAPNWTGAPFLVIMVATN